MYFARRIAAFLLTVTAAAGAHAQVETFRAGAMQVARHGQSGTPVVLLPGLASGAWVWKDTIAQLEKNHVVYVATLAGFDGQAPAGEHALQEAGKALDVLITDRKLVKPVLIGHSLGGTLAIGYAQQHPGALGGVVSIDGLPVFPGTENMAGPQRTAMAANMKAQVAGLTRDAFAGQQVQYMKAIGVLDPVRAAELAKLTANSDPASVGTYMADVLTADLRPGLNKIAVPVLVIAPYNAPDAMARGISEEAKAAYYRGLMAGVADLDVATVAPARHFAMLDQPEKVRALVAAFMEKKALR